MSVIYPFPLRTLSATHERILRVLAMTQRPLDLEELQQALGLFTSEAQRACKWLSDRGYIAQQPHSAGGEAPSPRWTLADKGRSWAKEQGALREHASGELPAWLQQGFLPAI